MASNRPDHTPPEDSPDGDREVYDRLPLSPRPEPVSAAGRKYIQKQTGDSAPTSRAAVAVACIQCRNRHLKCDGDKKCGRCKADGLSCEYVKSRRGFKGLRDKKVDTSRLASPSSSGAMSSPSGRRFLSVSPTLDASVMGPGLEPEAIARTPGSGSFPLEFLRPTTAENVGTQALSLSLPPAPRLPSDATAGGLVDAFYRFFFPAHPFLLPRTNFLEALAAGRVRHLLRLAVEYVGCFYVLGAPRAACEASLARAIDIDPPTARDAAYVQAMVLYAVGLHMAGREPESAPVMYAAIRAALDLGMNRRAFAAAHGGAATIMEECLRRTWWEIFVLDGMFSGVNMEYKIQLSDVPTDIPLPIEEADYVNGRVSLVQRTLQDYDESTFLATADEDIIFSSSTYRIDAVRIVHKVLAAVRCTPVDTNAMDFADTHLTNWILHLPLAKKKPLDRDGVIDEVMFEAHMIIAACTILLHRPRSDLSYEEVKDVTTCVGAGPRSLASEYQEYHTAKAVSAAMEICMLIKMPGPLIHHTPFFTCAITMAAVVYLSYWSFLATEGGDAVVKEHIRLNIGSLRSLSPFMPIAGKVLVQVQAVARDIFMSRKALSNVFWGATTREEVLQGMIEEVGTATALLIQGPGDGIVRS